MSVKSAINEALKNVFKAADTDGSGTLDRKELEVWADKLVNYFYPYAPQGASKEAKKKQEQRRKDFLTQWQQGSGMDAQDANKDGKVVIEEFVDAMAINIDLGEHGNSEEEIVSSLNRLVAYGMKTTKEIRDQTKAIWRSTKGFLEYKKRLTNVFRANDLDNDGEITDAELGIWKAKLDASMAPNADSEERKKLDKVWGESVAQFKSVDVDGDGKIDMVDFIGSFFQGIVKDGDKTEEDLIALIEKFELTGAQDQVATGEKKRVFNKTIIEGQPIKAKTFQGWEDARVTKINEDGTYELQFEKGTVGRAWRPSNVKTLQEMGEVEVTS